MLSFSRTELYILCEGKAGTCVHPIDPLFIDYILVYSLFICDVSTDNVNLLSKWSYQYRNDNISLMHTYKVTEESIKINQKCSVF